MGLLEDTPLASFSELEKLVRPAVRIEARRATQTALSIGASRFGGSPDLPEGLAWPVNGKGEPLAFLAQLNLREIAGRSALAGLPGDGWLLFFYDLEKGPSGHASEFEGWRVLRAQADARLAHRALPPRTPSSSSVCSLKFYRQNVLPSLAALLADDSLSKRLRSFLENDRERYSSSRKRLMKWDGGHRLLGYPDEVQGPMHHGFPSALAESRALRGVNPFTQEKIVIPGRTVAGVPKEIRALASDPGPWRLLLQLDTDQAGPGWSWGDAGRLYFWIRERDLTQEEFSRAWIAVQSG